MRIQPHSARCHCRRTAAHAAFIVAMLLFVTFAACPHANAIEMDEYFSMSPDQKTSMILDRVMIILAWLDKNDPKTACCFVDAFGGSDDAGEASEATEHLLEQLNETPKGKRGRTILGEIIIDWLRNDVCAR